VNAARWPLFRIASSAFLIENALSLWPAWGEYFTDGKMVLRKDVFPFFPSLYDGWPKSFPVEWILYIYILCAVSFAFGILNRWSVFGFYLLHASLFSFNPYIVHEPQQLASLFLLSFLFISPRKESATDIFYFRALTLFLATYYLAAALKKLPDLSWRSGEAVAQILRNPAFSRFPESFAWLEPSSVLSAALTYGTLTLELSFAVLLFSRFWRQALAVGVVFHLTLQSVLIVGNFGWIMLTWYMAVIQYRLLSGDPVLRHPNIEPSAGKSNSELDKRVLEYPEDRLFFTAQPNHQFA
jgi:hypothetical protein